MASGKNVRKYAGMETMEPTADEKLATLGALLKARRRQLGLNQHVAADRIGVSSTALSDWENGKALPSLEKLPAIARFLGFRASSALLLALENQVSEADAKERQRAAAQDLIDALDIGELADLGVQISRRVAIALGERGGKYKLE
jgi:transcriptional regulator with XRE-family HTH domain